MTSETVRGRRRARLAVAGVLAGVVLAACGGSRTSVAGSEPAERSEVSVSTSTTTATTTRVTVGDGTSTTTATTTRVTVANGAAAAAGGTAAVEVRQFQFMPAELAVTAGTTVTWTNRDDILHTATSGETPGTPDGRFDGSMDGPGKSFSHTFDQSGRFPYYCSRHPSMTGTVVVQ